MNSVALDIQRLRKTFTLHIRAGLIVEALHDTTFQVRRGEFTGLVGHSGSGKSTLLKCLYRTYLPDGGSAVYTLPTGEQVDLASAGEHDILALRRSGIGYISQALRVIPRVTVERTVARPLATSGASPAEALREARGLLSRLNLPENLWDSYPALLSGGEQQRVNVARALIARPLLLLLDEPTSALDSANQAAVVDLLVERLEAGATMVGAFHDAPSLRRLASQVVRLADGRTVSIEAGERELVAAGGAA
ncbi:MAG TPA: ATP-binding cassette domain-containing protein [Tepidiformaceae bacterium]|nr:ATP-binding cassette domain-containing protein [Tepidiformaceae bacterium]HMO94927.1 ATP-binding cassette domain-containing protein [Tepidiformaceae bacterium]